MHRFRSAALVLLVTLTACTTNPATGRREIVFMSKEREAALGREGAQQVAEEMGILDDPQLEAILTRARCWRPRRACVRKPPRIARCLRASCRMR